MGIGRWEKVYKLRTEEVDWDGIRGRGHRGDGREEGILEEGVRGVEGWGERCGPWLVDGGGGERVSDDGWRIGGDGSWLGDGIVLVDGGDIWQIGAGWLGVVAGQEEGTPLEPLPQIPANGPQHRSRHGE